MEVKEQAFGGFYEEKVKIQTSDRFSMAFSAIKQENPDLEVENQMIPSVDFLPNVKIKLEDVPEPLDLTEIGTNSTNIENIRKVHAEDLFVSASDLLNIKKEVEDIDFKLIKTELLNEECDLPSIKMEINTFDYPEEQPCSSQFEKVISTSRKVLKNVLKKKRYPCPVCQKVCLTSSSRKTHLDSHFGQRQCVICPYCGQIFTRQSPYLTHYRNYNVKTKLNLVKVNKSTFSCKICSKEFRSKKNLAEHFKVHYSKAYECKLCFKQYSVKSTLKRHQAVLHSILRPFKCEICYKEFALACQYKSHMSNHKFGKQFKCDICLKGFYQKSSLMRHRTVHEGVKFKCKLCSKEYTRKVTLESHMRLHSGEHEFKCHICVVEKRFTSKGALRLHLMNHAGDKPHKCEICSQRFLERQKLLKHLKTHDKAKNICEFCSVSFLYKIRLQRHLLTEHGENPFKCLKCSEKYATARELNLHMSVHVEFKLYDCEICAKQFTKRAAYVRHLGGHGQNPFGCGVCSQTFSSERGLREHYSVHPGEKPFHCDVCLKGFHHKRSLHKHICEGKPVGGS